MNDIKKIIPFFIDDRGTMSHLLGKNINITSILLVTSKKNSVRANHYHKKDVHYLYLLKGKMQYSYKKANLKTAHKETKIVNANHLVKTSAMKVHSMKFLEDSIFLAFSIRPRDRINYEKDTVRIDKI
jgi:quercetin dioxygenase-like cupin family protein